MKFTKAAAALCALTMVLGAAAPVSGGVLGFDTAINASAADKPTSGKCGENVNWSLSSDGTLTISGSGPMYDYDKSPFNDDRIKKVIIKGGVTRVGKNAFNNTGYYSSFTLENGVQVIGESAFANLYTVTGDRSRVMTFSLPSTLTKIESSAFSNNDFIKEITIPGSVKLVCKGAFQWCENLQKVTMENGVTELGDSVFSFCPSLNTVTMPDTVTDVGEQAFRSTGKLKSIKLSNNQKAIKSMAFWGSGIESIVIPGSVKVIGYMAFCECESLTNVTLSDGVAVISKLSFDTCPNLKTITIPKSVTTITDPNLPNGTKIRCYKGSAADNFFKDNKKYKIEYLDGTGTVKYGDVNKDGKVNDADVGLLQQYLADWKVTIDTAAADVTGDGKVNESDIGLLQQFLADWKVTLGK